MPSSPTKGKKKPHYLSVHLFYKLMNLVGQRGNRGHAVLVRRWGGALSSGVSKEDWAISFTEDHKRLGQFFHKGSQTRILATSDKSDISSLCTGGNRRVPFLRGEGDSKGDRAAA